MSSFTLAAAAPTTASVISPRVEYNEAATNVTCAITHAGMCSWDWPSHAASPPASVSLFYHPVAHVLCFPVDIRGPLEGDEDRL